MRTITAFMASRPAASLSLCIPVAAQATSVETIADALGLSADQRAKLQAGEIASSDIEESTEKQLAVALALKVPVTLEDLAESAASAPK